MVAIVRQAAHDLHGTGIVKYDAEKFFRSMLFALICTSLDVDEDVVREEVLRRSRLPS